MIIIIIDILGAPIGDYLHCSKFIAGKCAESRRLLSGLVDVAAVDLQVAVTLLHMCGSFCRMVHIAGVTPPSLASDALSSLMKRSSSASQCAQPSMLPMTPGARHSLDQN